MANASRPGTLKPVAAAPPPVLVLPACRFIRFQTQPLLLPGARSSAQVTRTAMLRVRRGAVHRVVLSRICNRTVTAKYNVVQPFLHELHSYLDYIAMITLPGHAPPKSHSTGFISRTSVVAQCASSPRPCQRKCASSAACRSSHTSTRSPQNLRAAFGFMCVFVCISWQASIVSLLARNRRRCPVASTALVFAVAPCAVLDPIGRGSLPSCDRTL